MSPAAPALRASSPETVHWTVSETARTAGAFEINRPATIAPPAPTQARARPSAPSALRCLPKDCRTDLFRAGSNPAALRTRPVRLPVFPGPDVGGVRV